MNTQKKMPQVYSVLLVISLLLSISCIVLEIIPESNSNSSKYVLYIGTNDKDTNKAEKSIDECLLIVKNVCNEYVSGYTIFDATGVWHSETNDEVIERTIVCCFDDIANEDVYLIADKLLYELNQECILIEQQEVNYTFYSGR